MSRYYVEKDGMWNVFSTIVDDFLYSDFMTFTELKALVIGEVVVDKLADLESLKTDKPILNKMPYEMAIEFVRERQTERNDMSEIDKMIKMVDGILGDDDLCEGCEYVIEGLSCAECRRKYADKIIKILRDVKRCHRQRSE